MSAIRTVSCVVLVGALASVSACASTPNEWEGPAPAARYESGLYAFEEGDHVRGRAELQTVLEQCGTTALGEKAAVALMAEALDPRHLNPDYAAQLAHDYLSQPYRTQWAQQLATTAYLVAVNLGARVDTEIVVLRSDAPNSFPRECAGGYETPAMQGLAPLPALTMQSTASRVAELERSVRALQDELARVRETLRP